MISLKIGKPEVMNGQTVTKTDWGLMIEMADGFELTDDRMIEIAQYITDICAAASVSRVFVDSRGVNRNVSALGIIDVNERLESMNAQSFKIAVFAPHLSGDLISRFFENVATQKSLGIRFFGNAHEAMEWLMGEGQPVPTGFKL